MASKWFIGLEFKCPGCVGWLPVVMYKTKKEAKEVIKDFHYGPHEIVEVNKEGEIIERKNKNRV